MGAGYWLLSCCNFPQESQTFLGCLHYTLDVLGLLLSNNYVYMVIQLREGELTVYPLMINELIYILQVKQRNQLLISTRILQIYIYYPSWVPIWRVRSIGIPFDENQRCREGRRLKRRTKRKISFHRWFFNGFGYCSLTYVFCSTSVRCPAPPPSTTFGKPSTSIQKSVVKSPPWKACMDCTWSMPLS